MLGVTAVMIRVKGLGVRNTMTTVNLTLNAIMTCRRLRISTKPTVSLSDNSDD